MRKTFFFFALFYIAAFCVQNLHGDYLLQSYLSILECYKFEQKGCENSKTFIEAFPNVSRSFDNITAAETRFYMFTKDSPKDPELMHKCGGRLPPNTTFNPKCRTEIFIPGFVSGVCHFAIYRELKDERLLCGCYNVLLVEWTWGNSFDLISSVKNEKIVAAQIAIIIRLLKEKYNLTAYHFILTGHSLGAHIAGFVGQIEEVAIINGIEPAGVIVTKKTPLDDRLDPSDAKCVQVTHCNAGQCLPGYFGVNFSCGTQDFYFNGGLFQKSCYLEMIKSFLKGDFVYAILHVYPAACAHFQCLSYYKASMCPEDKCRFVGVKCESAKAFEKGHCRSCGPNGTNCATTGAYACDCEKNLTPFNNYYLNTKFCCPYCDNTTINRNGYSCPAQEKAMKDGSTPSTESYTETYTVPPITTPYIKPLTMPTPGPGIFG